MPFPLFTWDRLALRYRDSGGRFVSRREVRQALDDTLRSLRHEMRGITQDMRAGKLTVGEWHVAMRDAVKDVHLFSAALAKGGWDQLTQADYGRVGQIVRGQYGYLSDFAIGMAFGNVPTDGRVLVRTDLYFEAGRGTFHAIEDASIDETEFDQERSVLHPADHCDECIEEAEAGWQPRGQMVPIGQRQCMSRCRCTKQYRNSQTGEILG